MKAFYFVAGISILIFTVGCDSGPTSSKGFTLPDGDASRGKAEFIAFSCYECHSVVGVELPDRESNEHTIVALGGEVTRIKTYGELVTSIINPSHKLAKGFADEKIAENGVSKMVNYNDAMTISQLTDLVTFLQSKYELRKYDTTYYPPYGY